MKKFVYPAVEYYDESNELYILYIEDLGVFAYGSTIEEAHANAEDMLASYVSCALKMEADIPEPTPYAFLRDKYLGKDIMLIDVIFDDKGYAAT